MERGLIKRLIGKQDSEVKQQEVLPVVQLDRIVVFGSRISGAVFLTNGFEDYLKARGIAEPKVHYVRNMTNIDAGFFNYWPQVEGEDYYPDNWNNDLSSDQPTLPRGVILLPEMRQYHEMTGMFVPTFESGVSFEVEKICEKYGVPLIEIYQSLTPAEIEEKIKALIPAGQ